MAETWQSLGFERLLVRTWDEESFVFNPASGETHLLNESALALLELLHQQPCTLDELLNELGEVSHEQAPALRQHLQQLELIGLLRRRAD